MRILINTPNTNLLGGVANHYKGLGPYWSEKVDYHIIGSRHNFSGVVVFPYDLLLFFFKLVLFSYDAVLLNPSLGKTAVKRDAVYLRVASFFKIKKIVFFHGWDEVLADEISNNPYWFIKHYRHADTFIVLSSSFKSQLEKWGITKPIILSSTKVDDALIEGFIPTDKKFNNSLLFLARIEEEKGIFVALDALKLLHENWPDLKLKVAGDGSALEHAKEHAQQNNIQNVEFLGNISGSKLVSAFLDSDIYILPTWYGEGMPTSVLEAMAFGLPIVSRPVGGLVDFFEEGKMGYLLESKSAQAFAEKVHGLLANKNQLRIIGDYNHKYAREHFMASQVARKLEDIIRNNIQPITPHND